MLQIITYLLCIYLIFKGVEIFQIGDMSTSEDRERGRHRGRVMILLSVIIALVFAYWITMQAESISQPSLPPSLTP